MDAPAEDFHAFFDRHYADLSRFAYLLLGGFEGADDLAADALVAVWRRWDSVRAGGHPLAYARSVVAGMARTRQRSLLREHRRIALFWSHRPDRIDDPDVPAVLDVRDALARLPLRKRACVVLRHAFDLSEKETARTLGISVGTVKSQTSRGIAELERMLAPARTAPGRAHGTVRVLRAGPVPAEEGLPPSSPKNLTIRFR
ncbi:SigE family RNA polymerase sigma factor [Streptomyces verrucosisporus]|uniref:SigE family RNA polymerase sigma factor n=1 Tax=Streptomyces verrucosisporus TaxID=1695161 RepID=UPI0019D158F1|nr:SigE family RNA polymerase sigma factor [Streptomyces verrucosisporus]MBN3928524.1 SigE family RNA polymerase sigma factor [Streptomyces verrucosisporus]